MLGNKLEEFKKIEQLPERRKWAKNWVRDLGEEELEKVVGELLENGSREALELVGHIVSRLVKTKRELVFEVVERLAIDEDWELREEAATVIKEVKKKVDFGELYPKLKEWVERGPYLARAVSVGLIQRFKGEEKWVGKILDLFEEIIQYDDSYVKKNCGSFGLVAIFRRYPERVEGKLLEWLDKYQDQPTVWWNVMMVFSQANSKYFPEAGSRVLEAMQGVEERFPKLKRSYESVWRKIGKS